MTIVKQAIQKESYDLNHNLPYLRHSNLKLVKAPSINKLSVQPQEAKVTSLETEAVQGHNFQPLQRSYFLERITALIEDNLDNEDFRITELCRSAGISRAQLHRNIKKFANVSTTEFINGIRLKHARIMLLQTDLNIGQIAFAVGYKDRAYFSRLFSQVFQISPRALRKTAISLV